jgi:hypothetical protein
VRRSKVCRQSSTAEDIPAEAVAPALPLSKSDALHTLAALTPLQCLGLAALGLAGRSPTDLSSWMLGYKVSRLLRCADVFTLMCTLTLSPSPGSRIRGTTVRNALVNIGARFLFSQEQ